MPPISACRIFCSGEISRQLPAKFLAREKLRPPLPSKYESKLEDGESMVNRPDLLQELGNIMQPIIVKEYENDAAMKAGDGGMQGDKATMRDGAGTASGRSSSAKDEGSVTDVTIKQSEE